MNTTLRRFAVVMLPLIGLAGCSTAPYKPAGFTDQQVSQKMNDLRQVCRHFRQGEYVNIKFYDGAPNATAKAGTVSGYFDAYNKMADTISLAAKPLSYSDRGEPYDLQYIAEIASAPDPVARDNKPNIVIQAVQNFFTIKDRDYEKTLLTQ